MTYTRIVVQDFALANPIYANAEVTVYTILNGEKTTTLADLFSNITGDVKLANPQTLDTYGKFKQPVYIQDPVIMTVTGIGNTPDHDTGVVRPIQVLSGVGSPEAVIVADVGTMYLRSDGGANTTLYIKESGDGLATGWVGK